ncbi:MAG: MerR family transcriptional regulator [Alphaproteobacteria bacterium]|nr:MerR family transcriptional regulator [Alphaproteobacteria bacterium]
MSEVATIEPNSADRTDAEPGRAKSKKSATAFRTISETADELHIPQHVLRFWEARFPQVRPIKKSGGRRYYRPEDVALLRRIADLLYTQGYTVKGVQRLLRERGGALTADIPPADEAEMGGQAELPMLELETAPRRNTRGRARVDPEVERLRAALAETLAELERLRALLR